MVAQPLGPGLGGEQRRLRHLDAELLAQLAPQRRERLLAAVHARDAPGVDVDVCHLSHVHPHVAVPAQHVADGRGDLALREDAGRHLVEEGLEQVVVGPVDDGDVDRCPLQGPGGEEATEPTADDHDAVSPAARRSAHAVTEGPARRASPRIYTAAAVPCRLGGGCRGGRRRAACDLAELSGDLLVTREYERGLRDHRAHVVHGRGVEEGVGWRPGFIAVRG